MRSPRSFTFRRIPRRSTSTNRRGASVLVALGVVMVALGLAGKLGLGGSDAGGSVLKPIDPTQQTLLPFGSRSHWLQPWRAYLDTVPAERLEQAIGIGFNVEPEEAEATARLLEQCGFQRARMEFGWDSMSFENPKRLQVRARLRTMLLALRRHHIRPLLLLNANHGAPGPTLRIKLTVARAAAKGARRVQLSRASAAKVVPGRTGFNATGKAADVIVTGVSPNGVAALSKPLPRDLARGPQDAATLRFEPFGPPRLAGGERNPRFEQTLAGWLDYVGAITSAARSILGNARFDVEIWNELSFGSDFLDQARYYDPPREKGKGDVTKELLRRTITYLRNPARRLGAIGITDGFTSQTPFPAGSTAARGLTALSKHPYHGIARFPSNATIDSQKPLDALGRPDFTETKAADGSAVRHDAFIPTYDAFFPEYYLNALQTETIVRDISPITTKIYSTRHGRKTHPKGGRSPAIWITEVNLDPTGADPSDPDNPGSGPVTRLRPPDIAHLQAKAALRYFTAFVNKDVSAIDLYTAKGPLLGLVSPEFFAAVGRNNGAFPGNSLGGETPAAVGRLVGALAGAQHLDTTHPLSLLEISDTHDHRQFDGDGTAAHPPLYDRDALAFFPFEVRPGRYVIATYVMTRNLAKLYNPDAPASDVTRYDLPQATFRLKIGNVPDGEVALKATDPLTGQTTAANVLSRTADSIEIEVDATDSPRLLTLTTGP